jgi:hypothetical protein
MLQSLQSYPIDHIIAVDGKYKGHPAKTQLSDKECTDLFKSFQIKYDIIPWQNASQIEKRQVYFELCKEKGIDVIIVMDSDEYVIHKKTNWPLFVEELENKVRYNKDTFVQGYTIPLLINQKGQRYPPNHLINSARVFHRPWELQYVDNHYTIRNKKTGVNMGYQSDRTVLTQLTIGTDHKLRDKEYMDQRAIYEYYQYTDEENTANTKRRLNDFIAERDSRVVAK